MRLNAVRHLAAAATVAAAAGTAHATWSIVIIDTRTGEVALASATCLTNFDLQANTPVMLTGIGGATAQSFVDTDSTNRTFIRDGLLKGHSLEQILAGLAVKDSGHQTRQYGMGSVLGETLTFSGTGAGAWAGGKTGQIGDLVYAVQGNVLTGAPVVDAAVDAIITTPGDVAEKLMASMEAARLFGGDGRCSCSNNDPDGCGSPPPSFTKSAHIAYMLIARAGDRDGCNPAYNFGNATAAAPADIDGDGLTDLVTVGGPKAIVVCKNISRPNGPIMMEPGYATGAGPTLRDVTTADFNSDGKPDAAAADFNNDQVRVYLNNGAGGFGTASFVTVGDGPQVIVAADFTADGKPDLVTANQNSKTLSLLVNNGAGAFPGPAVGSPVRLSATPRAVAAADFNADGLTDLVVATTNPGLVETYLNTGTGTFTPSTFISDQITAAYSLGAVDFDSDGDPDVFFAAAGFYFVAVNTGGAFTVVSVPAASSSPVLGAVRDITGDGRPDILGIVTSNRVQVVPQKTDGTFESSGLFPIGFTRSRLAAADFNNDGLTDLALPGGALIVMPAHGSGLFNTQSGLGGGDYFMTFNVPNARAADPDPVFTLRDQFNTWRAGLVGKPDAVQSAAEFEGPILRANGREETVLRIRPRDHTGAPVAVLPADVTIIPRSSSPLATFRTPELDTDGSLLVTFTAGSVCGPDRFGVRLAPPGARPVVLMPDVTLTLTSAADFNADGFLTGDDFDTFVVLFLAGDPAADFNADGFVTGDDFDSFVVRYIAGC